MAVEWPYISLREANIELIDCDHRTPPASDCGYPYVAIPQLHNGHIELSEARRIKPEHYVQWTKKAKPRAYDVVLSRRCNPGETAVVEPGVEFALGQNLVLLRADGAKVYPPFLRWLVRGPDWWQQVRKLINVGAVFESLKCAEIPSFQLRIPPLPEQHAITSVLDSLDDKIILNNSMNSTLEAVGQALFKRWFVDFEFPNEEGKPYRSSGGEMEDSEFGEIPKGWDVVPLSKIAEFTRGFSYTGSEKSSESGDYVFITLNSIYEGGGFKREFSYLTSERVKGRHLVREEDIVIANTEQTKTGTLLGFPALVEFPRNYDKPIGVFSHHITKVAPIREEVKHFLYHYLYFYQSNAIKYHTGSVIWALDVIGWTNNEKIILPKKEILIAFSKLMNIIFQRRLMNNKESNTLENIRDSLLPKLMSGEIRVKEAPRC